MSGHRGTERTIERELVVTNKWGIHARAAAQIVKVASQYNSEIKINKDGSLVNAKSILDIMTLECPQGSKLQVVAKGPDAAEALEALAQLFRNRFGEP